MTSRTIRSGGLSWAEARASRPFDRLVHAEALVTERGGDGVDDRGLVVDHEDALAAGRFHGFFLGREGVAGAAPLTDRRIGRVRVVAPKHPTRACTPGVSFLRAGCDASARPADRAPGPFTAPPQPARRGLSGGSWCNEPTEAITGRPSDSSTHPTDERRTMERTPRVKSPSRAREEARDRAVARVRRGTVLIGAAATASAVGLGIVVATDPAVHSATAVDVDRHVARRSRPSTTSAGSSPARRRRHRARRHPRAARRLPRPRPRRPPRSATHSATTVSGQS